jgi:hypothetical protein
MPWVVMKVPESPIRNTVTQYKSQNVLLNA